jgi:DNA-binding PadR family transcriptional regulator
MSDFYSRGEHEHRRFRGDHDGRGDFAGGRGEGRSRGGRAPRGGGRGGWGDFFGGMPPIPPLPPIPGFGPHPFGPRGHHRPRVNRGDVRAAALALIAEQPCNGYQIIQEIERRSDGVWRPSPGSVYPALQQLEDEGLVVATDTEGRKAFQLTAAGEDYVASHGPELNEPWATVAGSVGDVLTNLRDTVGRLIMAYGQVVQAGSAAQREQAKRIVTDATSALYRVLADGPGDAESTSVDIDDEDDGDSVGGRDGADH